MQRKMKSNNKKNPDTKLLHKKKLKLVEDCNDLHRKKQKKKQVHDYCSMDVLERAEEIHSSLHIAFPSFIKPMLPSHVAGCFWLGLPNKFCSSHLPKGDAIITLEDENGVNYEAKYLPSKLGLSAGWRGFAIAHNLVEGDVLIFQLVKPTKFKVYIVRFNRSDQLDEPTGLLEYKHSSNKSAFESNSETNSSTMLVDKDKTDVIVVSNNNVMDFKHPSSSDDFTIVVDGTIIDDSEIPNHQKVKYYELCCSQGEHLHKNLVKGLNFKLAAGIISETVNIADAIRTSKITTYSENLPKWEKTLSSFKDLGMEVGFLLARVKKLMKLEMESQSRINDARMERGRVEKEKIEFKAKLKKIDVEIKKLEKRRESMFRETANAPYMVIEE